MFSYDRNVVLAAYRSEHPELEPKEQTLLNFDADLFARFDAELVKQAQQNGIPLDTFSRSMLMFFSLVASPQTVKTKVSHACTFFNAVRPQLVVPIPHPVQNVVIPSPIGGSGEGSDG
jgi:hypothetical protein